MDPVTISPKYQVVIPKTIRTLLKLRAGQKLQALVYQDRIELVPVRSARELKGFLKGIDTTVRRERDHARARAREPVRGPIASVQIADARLNRGSAALVDRRRYTHSVPVISVFFGIVIRMFYQEHVPPHFHAEHQGQQASFDFTGKVLAGRIESRTALRLIRQWAVLHEAELARNWTIMMAGKPLERIPPLE